jgi:hypothetical protein
LVSARPSDPAEPFSAVRVSVFGTLQLWDAAKNTLCLGEMRACLDDGALVETVASEWRAVGADEAVEAIRAALQRDPFYLEGVWWYDELAPEVVLTAMPVCERAASGGILQQSVQRLTSGRGGLIWRQRLFRSRENAVACLAQHGAGLGLEGAKSAFETGGALRPRRCPHSGETLLGFHDETDQAPTC